MKRHLLFVMSFALLAACNEITGPGSETPGGNTPPTVDFTADTLEGAAPLVVSFTTTASDPDGDSLRYTLDFGDGQSLDTQNATHTYRQAGTYTAAVTVDDGQGGIVSDTLTIEVTGSDDDGGSDNGDGDTGSDDGDGNSGTPETCTNPVEIPDEVLEEVIRDALNKQSGDLSCADMAGIVNLRHSPDTGGDGAEPGPQIRNLSGLEHALSLRNLDLFRNAITDVTPLRNLTKLEELDLSFSDVQTIEPLSTLTNLRNLVLDGTNISSITPLANLNKLERLSLNTNRLTDLSALKNLANLTGLSISEIATDNFASLENLVKLEWLNISMNEVSDSTPLANLTQLKYLDASENNLATLEGLQALTNLQTLVLSRNTLDDISQLQTLVNLESLRLDHNNISDVSSLQPLTELNGVDLDNNRVSDIAPLVNNPGIGLDDVIGITENDLDTCPGSQDLADIQALEARGVIVIYYACEQ